MAIKVGDKCPKFTLPSSSGGSVDIGSHLGKQRFVLFFYPKADTPGCTLEACGFRDAITTYRKLDVPVYGISPDPVESVKAFAEKLKLNFPLLADADHAVCEAFGVWVEKNRFGQKYWGAARSTFIVGIDGRIAQLFENVDPEAKHDQQVLEWLRHTKS